MLRVWKRKLIVIFRSKLLNKEIVFGNNEDINLNLDVTIYKALSALLDTISIRITNLTYNEIVQLIDGQFYDVEVKAGYETIGVRTIFKGGVYYITNSRDDLNSRVTTITGGNNAVAKYKQKMINLTFNSGINLYSAIKFACKVQGLNYNEISTQIKKQMLNETTQVNNAVDFINNMAKVNKSLILNADSSEGSDLTLFDANKSNRRVINLTDNLTVVRNSPSLNKDGLRINISPSINIVPGDVIKLDNSIILLKNPENGVSAGYYLDEEGYYMVYEANYHLQNRGDDFTLTLNCKSRSAISKVLGGTNS